MWLNICVLYFTVLHSDYTTALSYLMKYPSNIDVLLIIRHSLHMYAPEVSYNYFNIIYNYIHMNSPICSVDRNCFLFSSSRNMNGHQTHSCCSRSSTILIGKQPVAHRPHCHEIFIQKILWIIWVQNEETTMPVPRQEITSRLSLTNWVHRLPRMTFFASMSTVCKIQQRKPRCA